MPSLALPKAFPTSKTPPHVGERRWAFSTPRPSPKLSFLHDMGRSKRPVGRWKRGNIMAYWKCIKMKINWWKMSIRLFRLYCLFRQSSWERYPLTVVLLARFGILAEFRIRTREDLGYDSEPERTLLRRRREARRARQAALEEQFNMAGNNGHDDDLNLNNNRVTLGQYINPTAESCGSTI
ncbi:hypothetical protein PIB30_033467 [Stylosanthes scabra]|uniref:Uncharacterized protein n=1 Tax=Stylosanthes scabra TaxID=79078 RepID=A0ABU6VAS5_9FABA|nr:hypothetical protein [Stylosanthes scabra]